MEIKLSTKAGSVSAANRPWEVRKIMQQVDGDGKHCPQHDFSFGPLLRCARRKLFKMDGNRRIENLFRMLRESSSLFFLPVSFFTTPAVSFFVEISFCLLFLVLLHIIGKVGSNRSLDGYRTAKSKTKIVASFTETTISALFFFFLCPSIIVLRRERDTAGGGGTWDGKSLPQQKKQNFASCTRTAWKLKIIISTSQSPIVAESSLVAMWCNCSCFFFVLSFYEMALMKVALAINSVRRSRKTKKWKPKAIESGEINQRRTPTFSISVLPWDASCVMLSGVRLVLCSSASIYPSPGRVWDIPDLREINGFTSPK